MVTQVILIISLFNFPLTSLATLSFLTVQALAFNNILPDLMEFYQEMDTRRALVDSVIDHAARLDRIYCSLPSAILADMTITTSTVVGLALNLRKCLVLVQSTVFQARLQQYILEQCPELSQIQVVRSCKYLGMMIGVSAHECYWSKPVAKFAPRVGEVRQAGLTLAKNIPTFNTLCLSLLSFVMQFAPLSRPVIAAYKNALQLLVVGPRFSFNYEMLTNMTSLGFPGQFKNLEAVSRATKFRLVSKCSEILEILEVDIPEVCSSDDSCILRTRPGALRLRARQAPGSSYAPALNRARGDPEPRDVALPDGSTLRVGLATDSLAYCLLAAHGDGALFIDVRPREAFNRSHIHGAWWLEHLAQEPPKSPAAAPLKTKQAGASNASTSTAASSTAPPARPAADSEEAAAAWETAVRQRCSLRTVVVYGAESGALKDPAVLGALRQLARLAVRPKGQLLVLRGGFAAFTRRFAFCARKQGAESSQPLPPSPAEILPPGCSAARGPPALYLGTERCLREPGAEKVLAALGVQVVVNLSGQPCTPRKKVGKVVEVRPAPAGGESIVATAREACEKVRRQGGPCLLYGPAAALAAAMLAAEALPSAVRTSDEADAWVRLRFPAMPVLDNAA
ncbi:unnamed protein product, partial [Prorocentrum cordatum]